MKKPTCAECKREFIIYDDDISFYKKIDVPCPKRCPQCRLIRRLTCRNTKTLYYRKCDLTGKRIISQYHKDVPFPVYGVDDWWGDSWDALKFGRDFDFSRPFFEQYLELENATPHFSAFTIGGTMQNSDFTNCAGYVKNCYLIAEADYNEDCYYSNRLNYSRNVCDCSFIYEGELCYECLDCTSCYNLKYSNDCKNCGDSVFLANCQDCRDCIGCINQRHKQYMVFNKQYSHKEYEKMKANFSLNTFSGVNDLQKKCAEFFLTQPHKNIQAEHNQNCIGNYIYDSKNCFYCFECKDLEDCRYCMRLVLTVKNSMDYTGWGANAELVYECVACGDSAYNLKFCTNCTTNLVDCEYCHQCTGSRNLFGCVGLKKKQYCILNKQYTKEAFDKLRLKIIEHMKKTGEWGEFFPANFSPFGYNETIAQDCFPLTKEEALAKGYGWKDAETKEVHAPTVHLADDINDVTDSITNEILVCSKCGKNYKITAQEFGLYRQMFIPIPRFCSVCRHVRRMGLRNPPRLWERRCDKCGTNIIAGYAPECPEIVYCEKCYLDAVY